MTPLNLRNRRFGRLLVLREAPSRLLPCGISRTRWVVRCDCGKIFEADTSRLNRGRKKSCGCLLEENQAQQHAEAVARRIARPKREPVTPEDVRLRNIWHSMKSRCYNPRVERYPRYGGRGIRVCAHWLCDTGFENFCQDMGPRPYPPLAYSIDRKDNDGNYTPDNCRWATGMEQARDKRMDCAGDRYGRLILVAPATPAMGGSSSARWHVRCDCGTERIVTRKQLTKGLKSCGCLYRETNERRAAEAKARRVKS